MDHKQKKDLQKKTERKQDNKDKKQSEKTRELEESKGTCVIRPFWFAVVGFILSMVALLSWFFSVSLMRFLKGSHRVRRRLLVEQTPVGVISHIILTQKFTII